MVSPASVDSDSHEQRLERFHHMGGNCLHLHGEGGETRSRQRTGAWLRRRGLRPSFILCTQICHDAWNNSTQRIEDRFTAIAVGEDISLDVELLGTSYLDVVYLDDRPRSPFEPVLDAVAVEFQRGRIRGLALRNFRPDRLRAVHAYAANRGLPGVVAVVTTELTLAKSTSPLWPEYVPFDAALAATARELHLPVFAHADDVNIGSFLFDSGRALPSWRRPWIERWSHPDNIALVDRAHRLAAARAVPLRAVSMAWTLNQNFPVVAIVSLEALQSCAAEYECGSTMRLSTDELHAMQDLAGVSSAQS